MVVYTETGMGEFKVAVTVRSLTNGSRSAEVEALVDTGATLCVFPKSLLDSIGVAPSGTVAANLADGREVVRSIARVDVTVEGRTAPTLVMVGEPTDTAILGVTALDLLLFMVDPIAGNLVPRKANLF